MRTILALAILAGLAACSSGEGDAESSAIAVDAASYSGSAADLLEVGMSQDDVRNTLGEPRTRVTMSSGRERWTYYAHDPQGQMTSRTLIVFDENGTLVDVSHAQR